MTEMLQKLKCYQKWNVTKHNNVLKIKIKTQEIGTDHLGLVYNTTGITDITTHITDITTDITDITTEIAIHITDRTTELTDITDITIDITVTDLWTDSNPCSQFWLQIGFDWTTQTV